jgi:ferredoxin-NADP reductase
VLLFYAAWDRSRMAFIDELEALQAQLNFVIIPVLESPPTGWPGERGYVTAEVLRRHLPRQYRRFQFFVCGPVPMMDALEKILVELGVPAAAVQTERFDMV